MKRTKVGHEANLGRYRARQGVLLKKHKAYEMEETRAMRHMAQEVRGRGYCEQSIPKFVIRPMSDGIVPVRLLERRDHQSAKE
jgi:2-hydroxychromene-2-carboxylate isomerase